MRRMLLCLLVEEGCLLVTRAMTSRDIGILFQCLWVSLVYIYTHVTYRESHNTTSKSRGHSGRTCFPCEIPPHRHNRIRSRGAESIKGPQTRFGGQVFSCESFRANKYGINRTELVTLACYYNTCDGCFESAI